VNWFIWDQLVVFLRFMVLPGNADATLASDMGPGLTTISKVVNRVKLVRLALNEEFVKLGHGPQKKRDDKLCPTLLCCFGFLDGTHFNSKFHPQCCFRKETLLYIGTSSGIRTFTRTWSSFCLTVNTLSLIRYIPYQSACSYRT
jgi:hypothetical protein